MSDSGGVETPPVSVPLLILLFPQDSIRQKWSSLIVTVRIWEVSELVKWSSLWLYAMQCILCTPWLYAQGHNMLSIINIMCTAHATFQSFLFPSWVVDENKWFGPTRSSLSYHETRAAFPPISISFALDQWKNSGLIEKKAPRGCVILSTFRRNLVDNLLCLWYHLLKVKLIKYCQRSVGGRVWWGFSVGAQLNFAGCGRCGGVGGKDSKKKKIS